MLLAKRPAPVFGAPAFLKSLRVDGRCASHQNLVLVQGVVHYYLLADACGGCRPIVFLSRGMVASLAQLVEPMGRGFESRTKHVVKIWVPEWE